MDAYQRLRLDDLIQWVCEECEAMADIELPQEILEAVNEGNIDKIKDYLDKSGDINAADEEAECLLSRACAEGQSEIVKLLLQYRNIHMNIKFDFDKTPLMRAVQNGHLECVNLLIDAPAACTLQHNNCWKAIAKCLQSQPQLLPKSAAHILREATLRGHWDVIIPVLKTEHHFVKEDLYPLILVAFSQNRWDVIYSVFDRDFSGKLELICEVFAIAVNMRSWEKVEEFLHMIDSDLKFDITFVEAALRGKLLEAQNMLTEGQYDSETLNGNLLVVAAGGTFGPIAELLMTVKNVYTKRTFSRALFLAAIRHCDELFPRLLHNAEASYSIKDLHQAKEELKRPLANRKREHDGILLTYFNNYLRNTYELK